MVYVSWLVTVICYSKLRAKYNESDVNREAVLTPESCMSDAKCK